MYFHTRAEAGEKLAQKLMAYRYENCAVVALSRDSVQVAEPIAANLHAVLGLFLTENIELPGENLAVGTVNQTGGFLYNQNLSEGERDDYYGEFHGYIDDQKREKSQSINRLMVDGGSVTPDMLREHVVVVVSDGLKDPGPLDSVADFLKPIKVKRLIIATPLASVVSVDKMHLLADELHCLSVVENYLDTDHYYDENTKLTHEQAVQKVKNIVLSWR